MNRFVFLLIAVPIFVSVSCRRSNEATQSRTGRDADGDTTEAISIHTGSVELVNQTQLAGIKTIAFASGINSLLVSDGTLIDEQGVDLEVLSPAELKRTANFTMTAAMSDGNQWSSSSLAVDKSGFHVLLYNQFIELNHLHVESTLLVEPVIEKGKVRPEPWSISPDGKLALVCVCSDDSHDKTTLATFDLATGQYLNKLATGRNIEYGCGCFLDNDTVASIGYDGTVTIHSLGESTTKVFLERVAEAPGLKGKNLRLQPVDGGEKLVVTGHNEFVVLDIKQQCILFRHSSYGANAIAIDDRQLVLWQIDRRKVDPQGIVRETAYLLSVANLQTGKIVGEYLLPTFYEMMVMDPTTEYLYAIHFDRLDRLKIDLSPLLRK